ncbi:MAG: cell division protein ZapA [Bacteroidetes bacterium]|jgi:cell division protein ZapA|nr:cell division protein ZapA [Bacteroidota bacterium]MBX7129254.1 cell division protein ZapA [Flavobacteriales bacterium]MCC6655877.1 cell division protein ZapA [Flavobacteriales bacterium]HMU14202.1 cell division protein ZapA [Flavobacteriales bacterium]HNA32508.1 cell division protein ZapA [Flavobacteriales bacterium]
MNETSIRIELAGRAYPLTVLPEEEANIRKAAAEINESIARLKASYPMTDKQDLLAMAALEVTTRAFNQATAQARAEDIAAVEDLERLLSSIRS